MKKFSFISGFPRCGNTLLASILNQNYNIHVSGMSSIPEIFLKIVQMTRESQVYLTSPSPENLDSLLKNIFQSYHQHRNENFILERGNWITPFTFPILNEYCPNEVKIVILVRPIKDIVKSYLNLCKNFPEFHINQEYLRMDKTTLYKSEFEEKIDLILKKEGYIDIILYSLKWLIDNDHIKNVRILNYDDLVENPKDSIDALYNFFDIPKYNHDFYKLKQVSEYGVTFNDLNYLKADLHTIRTNEISKIEHNINLPNHIIEKCDSLEFWKGKIMTL